MCHTWKGRNSQIGFRRSSHIASSLHDFLQQIQEEKRDDDDEDEEAERGSNLCEKGDLIGKQVEIFFETLEKECEKISTFLKSQYLLD